MSRSVITLSILLLCCTSACSKSKKQAPGSIKSSPEQEIRAALCEMDKRDYASAHKRMERVLQSDPTNIYAEKVLLGSLAEEIKSGDRSAENIVLIRKAIEGYSHAMKNPQFTAEERRQIDSYLVSFYAQLGREELNNELQRRASDSNRTEKDRADAYAVLASNSWDCSYQITSKKSVLEKSEVEKAKACVASGLSYANQAITLEGENKSAWTYKANLLRESFTIAGLEDNQTQKVSYQNQYDEALKHLNEISAKREAERQEQLAKEEQSIEYKPPANQPDDSDQISKELAEYRAETSLAETVEKIFLPVDFELSYLIAPVPIPTSDESTPKEKEPKASSQIDKNPQPSPQRGCFREIDGPKQVQEKRDWKAFAPAGEDIIVDLPDNVCTRRDGYIAASEGVMYSVASMARPPISLEPAEIDGVLNAMARTFAGLRSRTWLGSPGNSFEIKLLRKEDVHGQPHKIYSYALVSCSERKESVLMIQASKGHYYTIDISGAGESDQRVQRFLKSVRFK